MRRPKKSERGSVIVEFLLVFPAFIVLAMFVLEASLMWSDRHIERLAAFEAARALVAADLPEFKGGTAVDNPCDAPNAMKRARQAALRKIAIISPPLPLFLAKLGNAVPNLDFGFQSTGNNAGDAMLRLAKRWPTAVASTELKCEYDKHLGQVKVDLTYHRMLQTPLIDRVIYTVYRLGQINKSAPVALSLDENFLSVTAEGDALPTVGKLKTSLKDSFKTVETLKLNTNDAATFMSGVPGISSVFSNLTPAPTEIKKELDQAELKARAAGNTALSGLSAGAGVDNQAKLLTALVGLVPEALRRIPMTVSVTLQREVHTNRAITSVPKDQPVHEPTWDGKMKGVLDMSGGPFRTWGHEMSEKQGVLDFSDQATALEKL